PGAGWDVDDCSGAPVAPVRQPAPRQLTRRFLPALAFVEAAHPLHFTRCRIERHDGAPGACRRIQHATDHERRRLEIELRTRTQVVCLESPRDVERAEVAGIDLIEWRITMAGKTGALSTPPSRTS